MDIVDTSISMGKFFLDLIREIRAFIADRKLAKNQKVDALGILLKTYGSATTLCNNFDRLSWVLSDEGSGKLADQDQELILATIDELQTFGESLKELNLNVIDIFHPNLGSDLRLALRFDAGLLYAFKHYIAPRHNIDAEKIPKILKLFLDTYDKPYEPGYDLFRYRGPFPCPEPRWDYIPTEELDALKDGLLATAALLSECHSILAQIIRDNWKFEEIVVK